MKKDFFSMLFVCFYPAVLNFNRIKHIKSTVIGTLNIHFI